MFLYDAVVLMQNLLLQGKVFLINICFKSSDEDENLTENILVKNLSDNKDDSESEEELSVDSSLGDSLNDEAYIEGEEKKRKQPTSSEEQELNSNDVVQFDDADTSDEEVSTNFSVYLFH